MKEKLTTEVVRTYKRQPPAKVLDIYDTVQSRLVLRVSTSGHLTYRVRLGRGRWHTLGAASDALTPLQARELARALLGEQAAARALGQDDPTEARRAERQAITFNVFIEKHWAPWVLAHRHAGQQAIDSVQGVLVPAFGGMALTAITPFAVERWRTRRIRDDKVSHSTVNRNLNDLRSMFSKAVEWKLLATNPLAGVKPLRVDRVGVIRYLTADEERRLLAALTARDEARRAERDGANRWRAERGYQLWPALGHYADHLHPFVLTLLHTGARRGEVFSVRWADVELHGATLTIRGATAKSGQSRVIPLNDTIKAALTTWKAQQADPASEDRVFGNATTGDAMTTIKTAWATLLKTAKIEKFRLHDCRHTFASRLVMAGVDLVTVSRLLGHADVRMTMRYSHLAPEHMAAAVAKLVRA